MGFIAPVVALGSTILGAIGTASAATGVAGTLATAGEIYGAGAAVAEGLQARGIAKANQALSHRARMNAMIAGAQQESQLRTEGGKVLASQKAAYAGSGVDVGVGTPLDARAASQLAIDADASVLRYNSAQQGYGYSVDEWNSRNEARMATARGISGGIQGGLNAYGSYLSGASSLASRKSKLAQAGIGSTRRGNDAGITVPMGLS